MWYHGDVPEDPQRTALRRAYYNMIIRPLLTDTEFMKQMLAFTPRLKHPSHTAQQRDDAVKTLEAAVPYWDAVFGK